MTWVAGVRLSSLGDVLADRLGLGEALFGAVFFGAMISLSGIVMTATAGAQGVPEADEGDRRGCPRRPRRAGA